MSSKKKVQYRPCVFDTDVFSLIDNDDEEGPWIRVDPKKILEMLDVIFEKKHGDSIKSTEHAQVLDFSELAHKLVAYDTCKFFSPEKEGPDQDKLTNTKIQEKVARVIIRILIKNNFIAPVTYTESRFIEKKTIEDYAIFSPREDAVLVVPPISSKRILVSAYEALYQLEQRHPIDIEGDHRVYARQLVESLALDMYERDTVNLNTTEQFNEYGRIEMWAFFRNLCNRCFGCKKNIPQWLPKIWVEVLDERIGNGAMVYPQNQKPIKDKSMVDLVRGPMFYEHLTDLSCALKTVGVDITL